LSENWTWEDAGYIGLESGLVGFGDGRILAMVGDRRDVQLHATSIEPSTWVRDWQPAGFPFMAVSTGGDGEYPIERALDADGRVRALRVEFVSDVAEVEGRWVEVGRLVITGGRCVVADPFCMHSNPGWYSRDLGAPNGDHAIEVFHWEQDRLGIRILFATPLHLPQWGVD